MTQSLSLKAQAQGKKRGRPVVEWTGAARERAVELFLTGMCRTVRECVAVLEAEAPEQGWTLPSMRTMQRCLGALTEKRRVCRDCRFIANTCAKCPRRPRCSRSPRFSLTEGKA